MGRKPLGEAPMTAAERQRRARAVTKQAAAPAMTSAERASLLTLANKREKVAIADAHEYGATLLANFERKLATIYKPEDHPVWKEAHAAAKRVVEEAQAKVAATFRELGIPEDWAPGIAVGWYGRGENASAKRRVELRRVAQTEVDRRVKSAVAAIKRASVEAQEGIIKNGLSSDAAREMLASLPTPQQLLPELELDAIERLAAPSRNDLSRYGYDE